jgi:hypothetical protein
VKRLIVLLIVLAGGLAAAAFSVPSNAATVNGASISQNTVNSDLTAIAHSPDYQCFLNAEELVGTQGQSGLPSIEGVGQPTGSDAHPTVTASFASNYVDTLIGHQLVAELAAQEHLHVDAADLTSARTQMVGQMTAILQDVAGSQYACSTGALTAAEVLSTMPASFVTRTVQFDATVNVFEDHEAGVGSSAAELENYFNAHASTFDTACFTVAEYTSQATAQAAAAQVTAGTPFAQVATQATGGGPQGCDILYGVASSLPAGTNLESLPVGTVSSPITVSTSEYLLVQITSRTSTSFAKAESEVRAAVESAGSDKASSVINATEKKAAIVVDGRYGEWTPAQAQIIPPVSPLAVDVLNTAANSPATTTASSATASTGQTP